MPGAYNRITVYITDDEKRQIYAKAKDAKADSASKWAREVLVRESKPRPPRLPMRSD